MTFATDAEWLVKEAVLVEPRMLPEFNNEICIDTVLSTQIRYKC